MSVFAAVGPWLPNYSFRLPPKPEVAVTFAPGSLFCLNEKGEVAFDVPDKTPEVIRKRIRHLKDQLMTLCGESELEVKHTLIDGVYTRILFIPKDTVLIGKIHLKECVNIVAKGDISVLTETGAGRFKAGHVAVSQPGIQKLGYAHEDTVFINVFRTEETDIEKIEAEIVTEDYSAIAAHKTEALCL